MMFQDRCHDKPHDNLDLVHDSMLPGDTIGPGLPYVAL